MREVSPSWHAANGDGHRVHGQRGVATQERRSLDPDGGRVVTVDQAGETGWGARGRSRPAGTDMRPVSPRFDRLPRLHSGVDRAGTNGQLRAGQSSGAPSSGAVGP